MIGYALCGSFCTHAASLVELKRLVDDGREVLPILSETVYSTDTRFGRAEDLRKTLESICGRSCLHSITETEMLGPKRPLDALIIAPCTGNTLAKISGGITDTAVCMAAKAHLRSNRPLLIALASNDAMSANLGNIGNLLNRKSVYFVPMLQDDPGQKPHSLVADFTRIPEALDAVSQGEQLRPIFLVRNT